MPADRKRSGVLLVASKKRVHKQSVVRNRAKRRVRAALDMITFQAPTLSIVNISKEVVSAKFTELITTLRNAYTTFYSSARYPVRHPYREDC